MAKRPQTRIKELRFELAYWQMQRRIELRWAKMSENNIREIAEEMRKYQAQIRKK